MSRLKALALALAATLMAAGSAYADGYPPGQDTQAPRSAQIEQGRGGNEDVQSPRG